MFLSNLDHFSQIPFFRAFIEEFQSEFYTIRCYPKTDFVNAEIPSLREFMGKNIFALVRHGERREIRIRTT